MWFLIQCCGDILHHLHDVWLDFATTSQVLAFMSGRLTALFEYALRLDCCVLQQLGDIASAAQGYQRE